MTLHRGFHTGNTGGRARPSLHRTILTTALQVCPGVGATVAGAPFSPEVSG